MTPCSLTSLQVSGKKVPLVKHGRALVPIARKAMLGLAVPATKLTAEPEDLSSWPTPCSLTSLPPLRITSKSVAAPILRV
jgi:hypothetical protein